MSSTQRKRQKEQEAERPPRLVRSNGLQLRTLNPNVTSYEMERAFCLAGLVEVAPNVFRTPLRRELKRASRSGDRFACMRVAASRQRRGETRIYRDPQGRRKAREARALSGA